MKNLSLIASALAMLGLTACEKGLDEGIADVAPAGQVMNSVLQVRTRSGGSAGEEVKRVTSTDPGTVEDTEELTPDQEPTPDPSLEGGELGDTGNGGGGTTPSGGDDDPEN